MKIRTGFVSNSSSSSFIIGKYFMTPEQIDEFRKICEVLNNMEWSGSYIGESANYFDGHVGHGHEDYINDFMKLHGISSDKYVFE